METECTKVYVSVNLDVNEEGVLIPKFIRWQNGCIFMIDRIKSKGRAASTKVHGGGIRYTVVIKNKESFLFNEGNKWFVEAKQKAQ